MPIYHTTTMPSMELRIYLSELATIAALAKVAKQTEIYNQAKEAYDHLVSQYNEQARPKKKGFWEQFKDNLTFRDLDINSTELLQSLEEDSTYNMFVRVYSNRPIYETNQALNEQIQQFNNKHHQ